MYVLYVCTHDNNDVTILLILMRRLTNYITVQVCDEVHQDH